MVKKTTRIVIFILNPSRRRRSVLAELAGSKPEAKPEEGVASFAPLRMRFAVCGKSECAASCFHVGEYK